MTTREIVVVYFEAWQARDAGRFRALLADDVVWEGPSWRAADAEECMAAFDQASALVSQVDIQHLWVDGDDALTWFDIHIDDAPPRPAANWTQVRDGQITHIRATTDLLPPA